MGPLESSDRRALLFTVFGGGDGGGEVAGPTTTTTTQPLKHRRQGTGRPAGRRPRARPAPVLRGRAAGAEGGRLTIEVWWKGERARQSLVAQAPGRGRQESTAFVVADGNVFCPRTDTVPWSCQRSPSPASGAGAGIIDALVSSLHGKDVTSAQTEVGDEEAECYTLDPATGDVLCLREDDAPAKFTFSGAELVLARVETSVDDDVFEPPAEVPSGPPPSTTAARATPPSTGG